ncbi:hypothetical protein ACU686_11455 [Yinghuangia aomiensis]
MVATITADPADVPLRYPNTGLANGRTGVYRTTADIPADEAAAADHVRTVLGESHGAHPPLRRVHELLQALDRPGRRDHAHPPQRPPLPDPGHRLPPRRPRQGRPHRDPGAPRGLTPLGVLAAGHRFSARLHRACIPSRADHQAR